MGLKKIEKASGEYKYAFCSNFVINPLLSSIDTIYNLSVYASCALDFSERALISSN